MRAELWTPSFLLLPSSSSFLEGREEEGRKEGRKTKTKHDAITTSNSSRGRMGAELWTPAFLLLPPSSSFLPRPFFFFLPSSSSLLPPSSQDGRNEGRRRKEEEGGHSTVCPSPKISLLSGASLLTRLVRGVLLPWVRY